MNSSSLLKNILTYGLGQMLSRCLSLILLPLFTNFLTVEDYGILSLLNLIITLATSILTLGIGTAFSICYADSTPADRARILTTSLAMIGALSAACTSMVGIWAQEISLYLFFSNAYANAVFLSCLTATLTSLSMPFSLYLQFNHQALKVTLISVIFTLATLLLNIIFVSGMKLGVQGQVWGTFISSLLLVCMYWISIRSHLLWAPNWGTAKKLFKFGLPMIPASFALFFLQNSQRYFLDQYSTLKELGLYAAAFNLASVANLLVSAFSQAWTPYFIEYGSRQDGAKRLFGEIFTYYTYFFGMVVLGFFVFAHPVVTLATSLPFHPSAKIIGLIATGWILIGYYNLMNVGIVFAKKVYLNSVIQFATIAVAWIGNVILLPDYGMWGAAIVFLSSHLAMLLLEEACNFYFKFFRPSIQWRRIATFSLVIASMIATTYFLPLSSVLAEFIWGCSALTLAASYCYLDLTVEERQKLWTRTPKPARN